MKKETKMDDSPEEKKEMKVAERLKEVITRSRERLEKREQAKFSQWLQLGRQSEPDRGTKEGFAAWSRLHELYEFCQWVEAHNAIITEAMPSGLVAADAPVERHYEPEGGLTLDEWPYLKACCGPTGDEEIIQICRDEIVEAMLTNQLQKKGHSFGAASSAVERFACHRGESGRGALWSAIEESPFERLIASLYRDATTISRELDEYRRKQESESRPRTDGPDEGSRTFLRHGKPSRALSPTEFRLVSMLWESPEHSLLLDKILSKLWQIRVTSIEDNHIHRVRQLCSLIGKKLPFVVIAVTKDTNQFGDHYRVTLNIL